MMKVDRHAVLGRQQTRRDHSRTTSRMSAVKEKPLVVPHYLQISLHANSHKKMPNCHFTVYKGEHSLYTFLTTPLDNNEQTINITKNLYSFLYFTCDSAFTHFLSNRLLIFVLTLHDLDDFFRFNSI